MCELWCASVCRHESITTIKSECDWHTRSIFLLPCVIPPWRLISGRMHCIWLAHHSARLLLQIIMQKFTDASYFSSLLFFIVDSYSLEWIYHVSFIIPLWMDSWTVSTLRQLWAKLLPAADPNLRVDICFYLSPQGCNGKAAYCLPKVY